MPYFLQWSDDGLYRKFFGALSGEEIATSNLILHGDPRFDELNYIINDFSDIDTLNISDTDITLIANTDRISELYNRAVKVAMVFNEPRLLTWVEKYFTEIGPGAFELRVFDDPQAARQWVGGSRPR